MKNMWAVLTAFAMGESPIFSQVQRLPLGSPEAVTANAVAHVNTIRVGVSLKNGISSVPLSVPYDISYQSGEGTVEACIRRHFAEALSAVDTNEVALARRTLVTFLSGMRRDEGVGTEVLLLVQTGYHELREEGGQLVIPASAYEVDIPAAAKAAAYVFVPLFIPGVQWAAVGLAADGAVPALELDSRKPESASELRVLDNGVLLYARHLLISGRRGTVTVFVDSKERIYDHATGRLVSGEGALSLFLTRGFGYLLVEVRGKIGENIVFVERSVDLVHWTLLPGIFASRDEGYANYFAPVSPLSSAGAEFFRAYIPSVPLLTVSSGVSP